jgi:hypothetical protein
MSTATPAAPVPRAEIRLLALLILAQVVLFMVPLIVLGQAIGWPASLRLPAGEILPLVESQALAVQVGYWGYLATVLAMVPLVLALRRHAHAVGVRSLAVDCMTAFGLAAAVLKSLGIVRWLVAMPKLAAVYARTSDPALRTAIGATYEGLNGYAGSVGELLGVQLVSGLWMISLGLVLGRTGLRLNGWASLAIGAAFVACALRTLVPSLGVLQTALPPVALAWLAVFAVTVWRTR